MKFTHLHESLQSLSFFNSIFSLIRQWEIQFSRFSTFFPRVVLCSWEPLISAQLLVKKLSLVLSATATQLSRSSVARLPARLALVRWSTEKKPRGNLSVHVLRPTKKQFTPSSVLFKKTNNYEEVKCYLYPKMRIWIELWLFCAICHYAYSYAAPFPQGKNWIFFLKLVISWGFWSLTFECEKSFFSLARWLTILTWFCDQIHAARKSPIVFKIQFSEKLQTLIQT